MSVRSFAWLALAVVSGCSQDRLDLVPASGQVLIDGKPLTFGFIQVVPQNARPASSPIGPDGRFSLGTFRPGDGVVPGVHAVAVIGIESMGPGSQRWHAPQKYRDVGTSGLTLDVHKPNRELVIQLTWDGGAPFVENASANE